MVVAFSGGCDSALMAKVARDVLGRDRVKAVTAKSESLPQAEIKEVESFTERFDMDHFWIETREIENPNYAANPANRCYFCKSELYTHLKNFAVQWNIKTIVNGANVDDLGDWRPGLRAAAEYEIKSPLVEAGFIKAEVRELSRQLGLSTWDKPAAPCLSSRFPYGEHITPAKLRQVDLGEAFLKECGFRIVRLRYFGNTAKLELGKEEIIQLHSNSALRERITNQLKYLGFQSVEIDPEGYRSGKLNDGIKVAHYSSP